MKKLAQILKKDRRGFTLVEIIVVLAILAILIAVAIPSLAGVLKDSQGKVLMQDARAGLVAVQLKATENIMPIGTKFLNLIDQGSSKTIHASVVYDSNTGSVDSTSGRITDATGKKFAIVGFVYQDTSKKSDEKTVYIKLDDTAVVYDSYSEATTAAGADGTVLSLC